MTGINGGTAIDEIEIFGTPGNRLDDLATIVGDSDPYEGIEIVLDEKPGA